MMQIERCRRRRRKLVVRRFSGCVSVSVHLCAILQGSRTKGQCGRRWRAAPNALPTVRAGKLPLCLRGGGDYSLSISSAQQSRAATATRHHFQFALTEMNRERLFRAHHRQSQTHARTHTHTHTYTHSQSAGFRTHRPPFTVWARPARLPDKLEALLPL